MISTAVSAKESEGGGSVLRTDHCLLLLPGTTHSETFLCLGLFLSGFMMLTFRLRKKKSSSQVFFTFLTQDYICVWSSVSSVVCSVVSFYTIAYQVPNDQEPFW